MTPHLSSQFLNMHRHGFVRIATATPRLATANPAENCDRIARLVATAGAESASIVVFPELGVSGYAIDDLLQQDVLLEASADAIVRLTRITMNAPCLIVVGAPVCVEGALYNAAILMHRGRLLGVVPKTYLPNYREFYERRHFSSGRQARVPEITLAGQRVPFGTDLLFDASDFPNLSVHAELCEDMWVPIPPSAMAALAGATVLVNLSASNVVVGKSEYRHALCRAHSGRTLSAYVYSAAGRGESTTDLSWDGHAMIYECGVLMGETKRFAANDQLILADIDLDLLRQERLRQGTFADCAAYHKDAVQRFRRVTFMLGLDRQSEVSLRRAVPRFPYVFDDEDRLHELCYETYNIQVSGLRQRLEATSVRRVVIGISGGLDSTHALLVAAHTFDSMGLPRHNILAYTLPAFATSNETKANAWRLMKALNVSAEEIDLTPACQRMLTDIGHPAAKGLRQYDVTFENVQAGARTSVLFRLANFQNAIVLGTGDLSELALGWCTYGVGDHMSHYNVNASVPKTLIQHLIRWVAAENVVGAEVSGILHDVLETEISPELVPAIDTTAMQRTEAMVGPYELQDFNLFYTTRYGFRPSKIAFLAYHAWGRKDTGRWPTHLSPDKRNQYSLEEIKHWLRVFITRFFGSSQFKRSALPNGPKVSSGGSLSPRGDWRAPSDGSPDAWLADLATNVPNVRAADVLERTQRK